MKKLLLVLLLFLVVPLLSACEEQPHEECITEWEYKMEERSKFFISYTVYILDTEYGDVDVTKNIYESAQEEAYSEICVMVIPDGTVDFIGGTLIDGTPIEQSIIDEIADQVIPEDLQEEE
jgi:hypothetical protein